LKQTQDQPIIGAVNNRLRMKLFGTINDWMSVNLAYDFSSRVQDRSLFEKQFLDLGFTPRGYRAKDLDSQLYPGSDDSVSSLAIFQNLDRLYLTINGKWADLYLGRQAIAWGSAHLINPTDILVPYAFNQLDVEDRTGVDAFRIRIPAGLMGEIDAGYVFGEDLKYKNSALFLRGRFYYHRTDITAMGIVFQKNLLFGLDLARSLGGAGFWLEGGYVLANALDSQRHNDEEDYLRISIGIGLSFWQTLPGTRDLLSDHPAFHPQWRDVNQPHRSFGFPYAPGRIQHRPGYLPVSWSVFWIGRKTRCGYL